MSARSRRASSYITNTPLTNSEASTCGRPGGAGNATRCGGAKARRYAGPKPVADCSPSTAKLTSRILSQTRRQRNSQAASTSAIKVKKLMSDSSPTHQLEVHPARLVKGGEPEGILPNSAVYTLRASLRAASLPARIMGALSRSHGSSVESLRFA